MLLMKGICVVFERINNTTLGFPHSNCQLVLRVLLWLTRQLLCLV